MEDKICLDSDFIINFFRDKKEEIDFISENEDKELATTYINLFELYYGAYKSSKKEKNLKSINSLLMRLDVLDLKQESARKAGEILAQLEKKGNLIEFRDLLIGSIALTNKYAVKTNNKKHFKKIPGLKVI